MDIKPIYSALMRNKAGLALIVLQVAITLAVVCNSLFIIVERSELVARPSGMDEANTFRLASLGFVRDYDLKSAIRRWKRSSLTNPSSRCARSSPWPNAASSPPPPSALACPRPISAVRWHAWRSACKPACSIAVPGG